MALSTRKPTGRVAYPTLIVEGEPKSGKTTAALALSADERIGQTFVFELAEHRADEYASIGDFLIVEHAGSWSSICDQLDAAMAEPEIDGKPNVIIIDTMSAAWEMLKDQASAMARKSKRSQRILEEDPHADIETGHTQWNAVKTKWWSVVNRLIAWPGIVIFVAKAENVTAFEGGQPTRNTVWSRTLEKGTVFAVDGVVRARFPDTPLVTELASLRAGMIAADDSGRGGRALPETNPLGHLIFDVIGGGEGFVARPLVDLDGAALDLDAARTAVMTAAESVIFENPDAKLTSSGPRDLANIGWKEACHAPGRTEWTRAMIDAAREAMVEYLTAEIDVAKAAVATEAAPDQAEAAPEPEQVPESQDEATTPETATQEELGASV